MFRKRSFFADAKLLQRAYILNEARTEYVAIHLTKHMTPQIKILSSSTAVFLDPAIWSLLISFKNGVPKNTVNQLRDSYHSLQVCYKWFISIMFYGVLVLLSKYQWNALMDLACTRLNTPILKLFQVHRELVQRHSKFLKTNSFCTPPCISGTDFHLLHAEILHNA
jgi:hypothetical protein